MAGRPDIQRPAEGDDPKDRPPAGAAAVLRDLATAAEMIEAGAFDLAGQAHADTVSDLIRVAGDLRGLIEELAPRAAR